jgi:rSAM/selenodomain-associated transferase 2
MTTLPELSVIVPVLNEKEALPDIFATLERQRDVNLELVLSDGGSTDGTPETIAVLAETFPWPVTIVSGRKGRGRQLNAAVAVSRGTHLLFLHADSLFTNERSLRTALDTLQNAIVLRDSVQVAGRFGLLFRRTSPSPSLAYYYYECKARLDRRECIHGDQGMLMRRSFFDQVGPFGEDLPATEDTRLAEAIRHHGPWLLLPDAIQTSARRFETEGLRERQTLNAIIMNFASSGWSRFFQELPEIYRSQDRTRRLDLHPILAKIGRLMNELPPKERLALWYATGSYVSSHAWQIPFFLDTRRNFRRSLPPGSGGTPFLSFHDRHLAGLAGLGVVRAGTALLVWVWYHLTRLHAACKRSRGKAALPDS